MPHGLRSSTVPLIASSRTTKSVTKPTWYTRLQAEQAIGARDVRAKRTETLSGVSVGFASWAARRLGPTRPPRREMWPGTESNCRHEAKRLKTPSDNECQNIKNLNEISKDRCHRAIRFAIWIWNNSGTLSA